MLLLNERLLLSLGDSLHVDLLDRKLFCVRDSSHQPRACWRYHIGKVFQVYRYRPLPSVPYLMRTQDRES